MSNDKENAGDGADKDATSQALVTRHTYLEERHTATATAVALVDAPPEAPEPPKNINVFDFLVADGEDDAWESERDDDDDMRPEKYDRHQAYVEDGFAYGSTPITSTLHRFSSHTELRKKNETPAAKPGHSRNLSMDSASGKKSGKRKRGHPEGLDLSKGDIDMTDIPANLHSGLTGGINRLLSLTRGLPPSPDLSGDANSPQSPLKRSKRERDSSHRREKKPRRKSDSDRDRDEKRKKISSAKDVVKRDRYGNPILERRRSRKRSASPSAPNSSPNTRHKKQLKAIEYPGHSEVQEDMSQALVRIEHAPTTKSVDMFLTCLAKGSETDEGVSLWKALKRWRKDGGSGEKELWKRLKIRANEEGDLVLCV
jgi:cell growth-regulating nucleolar protein